MAPERTKVHIAVIGLGGVGKAVLAQLLHLRKAYPHLRLVLLSTSRQTLHTCYGLQTHTPIFDLFPDIAQHITQGSNSSVFSWWSQVSPEQKALSPAEILSHLVRLPGEKLLIDNSASPLVVGAYGPALQNGIHIVTPNKLAFSLPLPQTQTIQSFASPANPEGGLLYHESTVGAGLPIISTLKDLLATGDKIIKIEGVFSGTMSYLFNTFTPLGGDTSNDGEAQPWSAIVKVAQSLGYTEPDPRADLSGADVARKLVILARICGLSVQSIASFPVESLIPAPLQKAASAQEFLAGLSAHDGEMSKRKSEAQQAGRVLRYVGSIEMGTGEVKVGVQAVGSESALAGLKGADNVVAFTTERYRERPLVVQGAGAGADVTAMGVVSDVIKVVERVS